MSDLATDLREMTNDPNERKTIFEELYEASPSALDSRMRDDPHNVIFTTPYQPNANGYYGGNMSIKFAPSNIGSGLDIKWATGRGCAMPGQEATFCADRQRKLQGATGSDRRHPEGCDMNTTECPARHKTPDEGETRTPNYKEPREVYGLDRFEWAEDVRLEPFAPPPSREHENSRSLLRVGCAHAGTRIRNALDATAPQ